MTLFAKIARAQNRAKAEVALNLLVAHNIFAPTHIPFGEVGAWRQKVAATLAPVAGLPSYEEVLKGELRRTLGF